MTRVNCCESKREAAWIRMKGIEAPLGVQEKSISNRLNECEEENASKSKKEKKNKNH
jgi:hypothetical protein